MNLPLARFVMVALLAWVCAADAAEITIALPTVGEHRVDVCLEWGMQCNGEAADVWCTSHGYDRAIQWAIDADIGAQHPTLVLASAQVCDQPHCDGYASITCAIEDEWTKSTGDGGIVVVVERSSGQSPEGMLVIAVAEQDLRQSTAAPIGASGLALLHAGPGRWRLYAVNYSNSPQIAGMPGYSVDVMPGKDGAYVTLVTD